MEDLASVMRVAFTAMMANVYTSIPGTVVRYNSSTKTVDVSPTIKMVFENGEVKSMPIITDVQVVFAGTDQVVIQYKLRKGNPGLLFFSSQSLENWMISTGGEVEPGDSRKFALTDAFFLPGLFPPRSPGKVGRGTGLELLSEDTSMVMKTGLIEITSPQTTINGNVTIKGNLTVSGNANIGGDAIIGGVSFLSHGHPYSWSDPGGSGTTGAPV